ncbi:MAG: aldehyde dehydrogenase family protein, partial [Candidatus Kapabacteria bacterium]|nr:aldehyde dehydrogenase family protein [Candidatus Kapabacteria bacterium]
MKKFSNYINGAWIHRSDSSFFQNINPADSLDIIGEFPESNSSDIDDAVKAAQQAYKQWRLMPAPKRGNIIRKAGDIFERRKEELARIMTREMGKP